MKALVLGATGFIGGNVVRALLAQGHQVRAFRRRSGPSVALDGLDVEEALGDLRDSAAVEEALAGCDVLFHAAGYYPQNGLHLASSLREGVLSVRGVLEAAARSGVSRLVYTSSLSTVGPSGTSDRLAQEEDYYLPGTSGHPYAESKFAMEQEVYRYIARGLPAVVVCPTVVFGPGDVKPTSGLATLAVARGQVPFFVEGRLNVVDVRDVAAAQVAAATRGRLGEKYILGAWNLTVEEMIATMAQAAGVSAPRRSLPGELVYALASAAELVGQAIPGRPVGLLTNGVGQALSGQYLDTSKAERELGLTRRPLIETFRDSLAWFREHSYL